jgi:uncharacterized protein YbjT (DUF2867 family)
MRVLVVGGTGNVGSRTVALLRAEGHVAIAASRSAGNDGLAMDITRIGDVIDELAGFDAAFLITPLGPDEGEIGVAAVHALRKAGIGRIVHLGIHNVEAMRAIPHFECKIPIKQAILDRESDTVLEANFFFQNDLMALPALMGAGIYALPIGSGGVWSVDAADIAKAATRVLNGDEWAGRAVPVCGPQQMTGPDCAESWGKALGRKVAYAGDAIDPFVEQMRASVPDLSDWMAEDFRIMMQVTQAQGCPASTDDLAESENVVGAPLTSHTQFAVRTLTEMNQ